MKKKIIYTFLIIIVTISSFIFTSNHIIGQTSGYAQKIKYLIPGSVRNFLRDTFFAKKYLVIENNKIKSLVQNNFDNQVIKANGSLPLVDNKKIKSETKLNNFFFSRYKFPYTPHFEWGNKPVGYLSQFNNFIFLISGSGEITYFDQSELDKKNIKLKKNTSDKEVTYISGYGKTVFKNKMSVNRSGIKFKTIKSNFYDFVSINEYIQPGVVGPRDMEIINNDIYISFVDKKSCDKVSIIRAKLNFDYLDFKYFFSWKDCSKKSFIDQRSGGRIKNYDKDYLIFTVGDYSKLYYPPESQNPKSLFGKIIKINKKTSEFKILSIGHRNPQGLYVDSEKKLVFSTDHGPDGGDEVNFQDLKINKIENFGWPISSYGVHYSSRLNHAKINNLMEQLEKGAPLHKSHKKFNFTEPLKYYAPKSIGISEIIKIPKSYGKQFKNDFFVTAMGNVIEEGDQTIHHISLDNENQKIISEDKIILRERIRDIIYNKKTNAFLMILETGPSIGVLKFNNVKE